MSHPIRDKAKAHFASRGTRSIDVPEWECTIHYRVPNLQTLKTVMADGKNDPVEMQARIVAAVATDEKGDRIWGKLDYKELMVETDPGVVARIANAIMSEAKLDVPAAEGN